MAFIIGTVTLPEVPERMSVQKSANKQTEPKSGDYPLAMVDGFAGSITLSGKLEGSWLTNFDSILSSLLAEVGTAVSCTIGGELDGTYLLDDFKFDPENPSVTPYTIKLTSVSAVYALT
jgi:hypothetical protein